MHLHLLVIKTAQIDHLAAQYELLGFTFHHHRHGKGPMHYAAELGELVFEIYPSEAVSNSLHFATRLGFTVKHLPRLFKRLAVSNWTILTPPSQTEWGFVALIQDIDGRKVELKEYR